MNSEGKNMNLGRFNTRSLEQQYTGLLQDILLLNADKIKEDNSRKDRTGTGTYSVFDAPNLVHELTNDKGQNVIPLLHGKYVHLPAIIHELIWMLSGSSRLEYLLENKVRIWNEWVIKGTEVFNSDGKLIGGDLGPVYGKQWRDWNNEGIDQIAKLENSLRNNPFSRRHIITAWNVSEIENMALPPCHTLSQFYVREENGERYLDCKLYARSQDLFLGTPFNIAFYSILTILLAELHGFKAGRYIHVFGDAHIYSNHIDQVREYLTGGYVTNPVTLDFGTTYLRLRETITKVTARDIEISLSGFEEYKVGARRIKAEVSV